MLRFLADENFNNHIVRGVLNRLPDLDLVRVQNVGFVGDDDPTVLEWAATENRIVLTHDVRTMTRFALERLARGLEMPGIVEIGRSVSIGDAIEDLILFAECSLDDEWQGQIVYFPL